MEITLAIKTAAEAQMVHAKAIERLVALAENFAPLAATAAIMACVVALYRLTK